MHQADDANQGAIVVLLVFAAAMLIAGAAISLADKGKIDTKEQARLIQECTTAGLPYYSVLNSLGHVTAINCGTKSNSVKP